MDEELPALRQRLDDGLALIRERIAVPDAKPGLDCGSCKHVWKCPAHPDGVNVSARRGALAPGIVTVTPTSFEAWHRCRRAWRNQYLLSIAASDDSGSPDHGQRLHDVLRFVHDHGSCHDEAHVNDVLENHGGTDRLRDELERHAQRCPSPCEAVGHEMELARFHREPWPPFMATARLDAVWVHDGMLDARDYKTGKVWYASVGEDPRALVQAYVLAPLAAARGLRLRIRYEHLATEVDEDPEPWEPDADELDERGRADAQPRRGRPCRDALGGRCRRRDVSHTAASARSALTARPQVSRSGRWSMRPTPRPTRRSPRSSVPSVATPARTPVIVGVGQAEQHVDDPAAALEPIDLLARVPSLRRSKTPAQRRVLRALIDTIGDRADRVVELSGSRCTARTAPRRGRRPAHGPARPWAATARRCC